MQRAGSDSLIRLFNSTRCRTFRGAPALPDLVAETTRSGLSMKRARAVLSSLTIFSVHDRRLYSPVWRCYNALACQMHERNTCLLNARTAMNCTTMLLMMHAQNAPSRTRSSVPSAATRTLLRSQTAHIVVSITTRSSQCQLLRFSIRALCILMAKARTEKRCS